MYWKIDPFLCHVREFLDFLADLYEEGLEHRTVNSIRSAVSMTHCHVEGVRIGQHPLVTQLIRGYATQDLQDHVIRPHGMWIQ